MNIYTLLNGIGDSFKRRLQQDKRISHYAVDIIPDDLKINVVMIKAMPIKHIRCTVSLKDTDNNPM